MKFKDDFIETIKHAKVDRMSLTEPSWYTYSDLQWWHIIELEEDDFNRAISIAMSYRPNTNNNQETIADKYMLYKKAYLCGSISEYALRKDLHPANFIDCFQQDISKRKQKEARARIINDVEQAFVDSNLHLLDTYNEIVEAYIAYFKCQRDVEELPKKMKEAEKMKTKAEKMLLSATSAKQLI